MVKPQLVWQLAPKPTDSSCEYAFVKDLPGQAYILSFKVMTLVVFPRVLGSYNNMLLLFTAMLSCHALPICISHTK